MKQLELFKECEIGDQVCTKKQIWITEYNRLLSIGAKGTIVAIESNAYTIDFDIVGRIFVYQDTMMDAIKIL